MREPAILIIAMIFALVASTERVLAKDDNATGASADKLFSCGRQGDELKGNFYADNEIVIDQSKVNGMPLEKRPAQGAVKVSLDQASMSLRSKPYIQSFIVVQNSMIVYEEYYNGMDINHSANIHSASKSIWGAAIGVAISRGLIPSIDTPINSLLPAHYDDYFRAEGDVDNNKKNITLKNVLSMTSCLEWDEDSTEDKLENIKNEQGDGRDWVAAILNREILPKKECVLGKTFHYNTGNTQLISAILEESLKRRGINQSSCEFIHENILHKIGVSADKWAFYEQGYFAGGHSLWLSPRELAKFGLLYVNKGMLGSEQIIPEQWIKTSQTAQIRCPSPDCRIAKDSAKPNNYGFNFWLGEFDKRQVTMAWGYGAQMIYIIKDLNLVVVITTDTVNYSYERERESIVGKLMFGIKKIASGMKNVPEHEVMAYLEKIMIQNVIKAMK